MGCLYTLLGLLVLAFFAGPWVMVALQYRRHRQQVERVDDLQSELGRLRAKLELVATTSGLPAAPSPAAAPAAVPAPSAAAAPSPIDRPAAAASASTASASAVPIAATIGAGSPPLSVPPVAPPIGAAPPPPPTSGAGTVPPGAGGRRGPVIDWERWIGVRGAAVLGGIVLALAGILFARYSIEHGLISPALRVAIGIFFGLASITASQRLRSRGYRVTADSLAGAGIVLLYAALWSAHSLYHFVGAGVAYALMSLVTVACGVLSWRYASVLIAVLGLVGGFATPLLIEAETDNPIGLFGYVLLLDLGLIALARRRGWSALALLALIGTVFYQGLWVFTRMRADSALFGLAILGLFALVFGFAGWARSRTAAAPPLRGGWVLAEGAGLLAPFAFALYFASRADLGPRLYPVAALVLILSVAAQWIGRRNVGSEILPSAAAAGSLAVVAVWSWDVEWTPGLVWEVVAVCVVLAAAFHVFSELDARSDRTPDVSVLVAEIGLLALLVLNSFSSLDSPWPWVAGLVTIGAMLVRLSIDPQRAFTPLIAAAGIAAGLAGWFLIAANAGRFPAPAIYFGVVLLLGAGFQVLALARSSGPARRSTDVAAVIYAGVVLAGFLLAAEAPPLEATLFLAVSMLLGLLVVLAATRLESGGIFLGGMVALAIVHTAWSASPTAKEHALLWLLVDAAAVIGFAVWPSLAPRLAASPAAWRAAALAAPVFFVSMGRAWEERFGDRAIGLLPIALAAITLGAAYRGRRVWASDAATARTGHLAWFGAIALGFAAVAVPLQLEKEWITVGWALEGLAVTALWKRLDHPGLKYFAAALFAAVTVRLLANPEILRYHERGGLPVLNWIAYTYLVPAACLLGAARILGQSGEAAASPIAPPDSPASLALEVSRARPWERTLYSRGWAVLAGAAVVGAILVVFAWINLTIFDAFATGSTLTLSVERLPARDLTLSLAWVVYAVTLLGFGMARDSSALRWLSLGFLVLSIGKVFLYDLGELRDLYRVASLVGLAISLILVSLAYQRFVFGRRPADEVEEPGHAG